MIPIMIQNTDRAISARDYKALGTKILVTSMFSTIQGEGPYSGHPAMFVRLAGCNYGDKNAYCQFCDTSFFFDKGEALEADELVARVLATEGYHPKQVLVITGGEPTLQVNLLAFIMKVRVHFKEIQIETNGTQPKFYHEAVNRDMMRTFKSVVSPKANVKTAKYPQVSGDVLWWATCLKFVVSADPDSPHHEVPQWALDSAKNIYVSPMAVYLRPYSGEVSSIWEEGLIDKVQTARNYNYAAEYAMKHRLLLSVQTHLFIGLA